MLKIKNIYANFNYCNNNNSNNKSQVRLKTMYKVAASLSPFSLFLLLSISLSLFPSSLLLSQLGENFTPFAMRLTAVLPCLPHFLSHCLSPSLSLSSLYIHISPSRSSHLFRLSSLCVQLYANYGKLSRLCFFLLSFF